MHRSFDEYRAMFPDFYARIKHQHAVALRPHRGHGLDHDVTVAMLASLIAPDHLTAAKAWCSALLHSMDRMVSNEELREVVMSCSSELPESYFTATEIMEISMAAIRHGELNRGDQSLTQQVLMDADRLANLMPATMMRAGQFLPEIPTLEFGYLAGKANPRSTYYEPASVLDDLRANINEYIPKLRIREAKNIASQYVRKLENFIQSVEQSYAALGLSGIEL